MIAAITSLADLRFKSKTNADYQKLALLATRGTIDIDYTIDTVEKALDALDKYQRESFDSSADDNNCLWLTTEINDYRERIQYEEQRRLHIIKEHERRMKEKIYYANPFEE